MPELPEVETIKRELAKALAGKRVRSAEVLWTKTVAPLSATQFKKRIQNKEVKSVDRQAKMLIIDFNDKTSLVFHLKMTGQLIFGGLPNSHTRLILEFTDHSRLFFNDLRKFGWARLVNDQEILTLTGHLGIEPFDKKFTPAVLKNFFNKYPNRTVKQILLDQTLVAGIGNIYADEACFLAKIRPDRRAETIKPEQIKKLHQEILAVLKLAIQKKGTSARDYLRSNGKPGGFVPHLFVYGRSGQPCKVCETIISKIKHAGRGTHFCPKCQKQF